MPDLIRLGLVPFPLQVDEFLDARHGEDMVTTANTLLKAQIGEELAKIIETDVGIRATKKDPRKKCLSRHVQSIQKRPPIGGRPRRPRREKDSPATLEGDRPRRTCIEQLSRSSRFIDSRRGLELLARTLLPAGARRAAQLDAIARAFDTAGIRQA